MHLSKVISGPGSGITTIPACSPPTTSSMCRGKHHRWNDYILSSDKSQSSNCSSRPVSLTSIRIQNLKISWFTSVCHDDCQIFHYSFRCSSDIDLRRLVDSTTIRHPSSSTVFKVTPFTQLVKTEHRKGTYAYSMEAIECTSFMK
jgi:hypothetical protein